MHWRQSANIFKLSSSHNKLTPSPLPPIIMAHEIRCKKAFMKRKQLGKHMTQWKWRKLAPLTLQRGMKFKQVHPHDWYMYYRIIFLLGQYVKHVTCINVWNVCVEKALELFLDSLEICSVLEHESIILYVFTICFNITLF